MLIWFSSVCTGWVLFPKPVVVALLSWMDYLRQEAECPAPASSSQSPPLIALPRPQSAMHPLECRGPAPSSRAPPLSVKLRPQPPRNSAQGPFGGYSLPLSVLQYRKSPEYPLSVHPRPRGGRKGSLGLTPPRAEEVTLDVCA